MKRFYNPPEVATICEVASSTVTRWIQDGKLATSVTAGGHYRICREELVSFLRGLRMPIPEELEPSRPHKVLVIDDEKGIREMVRYLFKQSLQGFECKEAKDGFQGGVLAERFNPDLILLDLMMPNLDGFSVCQTIRNSPKLQHAKIIIISALSDVPTKKRVSELGADDFLAKPFQLDDLVKTVKKHLNLNTTGLNS